MKDLAHKTATWQSRHSMLLVFGWRGHEGLYWCVQYVFKHACVSAHYTPQIFILDHFNICMWKSFWASFRWREKPTTAVLIKPSSGSAIVSYRARCCYIIFSFDAFLIHPEFNLNFDPVCRRALQSTATERPQRKKRFDIDRWDSHRFTKSLNCLIWPGFSIRAVLRK